MSGPIQEAAAEELTFDAVIATRNRPDALALSIPILLEQSHPPAQLIVIDSSDEHAPVAKAVAKAVADANWDGPVTVEHCARSLPRQRNRGLAFVTAPIVLFPDDDSLLLPGAAEAIMAVYKRDTGGAIAGVGAAETLTPPDILGRVDTYEISEKEDGKRRRRPLRVRLNDRSGWFAPLKHLAGTINSRYPDLDWFDDMDVITSAYMTGFRMSYRTDAIRNPGVGKTLTRYALCEDIDASLTALRSGMIVSALRAEIYHHRLPAPRANGRRMGTIEVLNQLYVFLKRATPDRLKPKEARLMRRNIRMFLRLKFASALMGARSRFGRERLGGYNAAYWSTGPMWRARSGDALIRAYEQAVEKVAAP